MEIILGEVENEVDETYPCKSSVNSIAKKLDNHNMLSALFSIQCLRSNSEFLWCLVYDELIYLITMNNLEHRVWHVKVLFHRLQYNKIIVE